MRLLPCLLPFALVLLISCGTHGSPESVSSGQALANTYCRSCHILPEPAQLSKEIWENTVLPRMGYMMGIFPKDSFERERILQVLIEAGEAGERVKVAGRFPQMPTIKQEDWEKIQRFYIDNAPEYLAVPQPKAILKELPQFHVQKAPFQLSPPSTTLTHFGEDALYVGDANTKKLYRMGKNFEVQGMANVREGAVKILEDEERILLTVMGSFSPTDAAKGFVMQLPKQEGGETRVVLPALQRPVDLAEADLDQDGRKDLITCEFGKWTGSLSWWKQQQDGSYTRQVLRAFPGATSVYVRDLNQDGKPDLVALFGQGDEGVFAYYNQGEGKFLEKPLLRFPPSYGSSYLQLFDWNGDGHEDLIYLNGDNADYQPILKPYHGIRIYLYEAEGSYKEHLFYPLHGAYKAIPADFDKDGDLDMAVISFFPDFQHHPEQGFVFLENQGEDEFIGYTSPALSIGRWLTLDADDFDEDGDLDLVMGSLTFTVVPSTGILKEWVKNGIPFVYLENNVEQKP